MVTCARLAANAVALFVVLLLAAPAGALNLVSWVGSGGSNANGCASADDRCASIGGAITKTEPSGEIRCVDSLGNGSSFAIDKPITIDCTGVPNATLGINGSLAISINLSEATYPEGEVVLRGLTIDGFPETFLPRGSDGIRFFGGGGALYVENCRILGFAQQGIDFTPTSSADLFVRDTIISNNAGGGVVVAPAATAVVRGSLSNVRVDRNGVAGLVVTKSSGTLAAIAVENSLIEKNTNGLRVSGSFARILLSGSTISLNTLGLQILSDGKIFSAGNNNINLNSTNGAPSATLPLK